MSKSKEKLQQFSSQPATTTTIASSSTELKNSITHMDGSKKLKDDDDEQQQRLCHSVVKKEQSISGGGGQSGNNNNNKSKTIENNRNRKKLKDVNDVITCFLCDGYYIEATTINECLHSFCRSCIVQYLQNNKYCPKCKSCNKSINITNLRPDTALRSLVYKLVPGLCQSEIQRLVRFNSNNSASSSLSSPTSPTSAGIGGGNDLCNDLWDFYSPDEMISLSLEYHIYSVIGEQDDTSSISQIRYLKCPAAVTVHHLQRFISSKFNLKPATKFSIEIIYEDEILPEDFSLMDVAYCYKWERLSPMQFFYRIFVKPEKTIPKPVAKCKKVQSISDQSSPGDDKESSQNITTPTTTTTTIVSTNNNNNNSNNSFSSNTTNNSNSNKNISNKDNNNVNNGDNNNNNNDSSSNSNNIKVETNIKEVKKEVKEEVQVKKENNNNNNDNSKNNNKIPNLNKSPVSVSPPQPPSDFKILRSNDIRYAITPSSVERPVDISPKKSNNEKRAKLSIKLERTQSHDDYNNNSKKNEEMVASSPIKRRASASNSITLKRKYNKTDDEDDSGMKKSRSHHHHHHHHQKYEIVQSPKVFDDDVDIRESTVPKIKLDLPNLKAKIKVPKPDLSPSKNVGLKSPSVTSSSSNSSSPRCSNDDVFLDSHSKYVKTGGLTPNSPSTDQISSSHHHKHHHGDTSSSHKKRKKSKHSKDSPAEEISSNGSGNNGYSSNGNSKKRKIHAEISPQTEKSQDDLKLKFKINYKPAEKPKPPIIPTMVIDDDSSDKIIKTPTSPRIIMTLPVPSTAPVMSSVVTSTISSPALTTTVTSTTSSLMLPKPNITSIMPTLVSTNMIIPTPTISNSISQDVEEVIKRNKIKKTNIEIPHRMSPNTEEILNEMRAIHSATQAIQKPMVNIPHLSQVHLQNNDPIYGSKSPEGKNSNPMLVSIRNTNPPAVTSPSSMRHQLSPSRPQMNIALMPSRQQKHGGIKPPPFNFSAATFANNTYNHPRTPFPILKSINLQRKSCYDIDPIDKKSPQKSGPSTSIFDFPSEPSSEIYTKKEKNQKRLAPPVLFDEPFSSIINSMTKVSKANEMRAKNLFPSTTTTTTSTTSSDQIITPVKSEPPFISSIGNSFISENQNSRTPIQPIQLPPASVSVTNVTNKVTSNQLKNQQTLKHSSGDHKPVVEILRIQSTTPAVDQQIQPQKVKPNRPPPPLIKRPQVMNVSSNGNQQRRTSASSSSSASDVKKVENSGATPSISPKVERKSSSETKEPPQCDKIGALDLSGKSSRSPSLEKSPISKSSSRSNSTEDDSFFNTNPSTVSNASTTPPKLSLSKQKKITDMFPSTSWSVKVENNGSMNISSADRSSDGKSKITITATTTTATPVSNTNISTSKPPPPKLTEISKLRTYTNSNSTKSIPTTSATTITSVRQQNLSIRNVPNPSALAFRNQMSPNPISANNNNNNNNNSIVYNGNNANNNNKTKVNEGKEIEKVIAHLKANAAADSSAKTVTN